MTKEELKKEAEEYDLIIRFKSNKPKYEIRDYIIKHTLNDFDNLQMWDFKRSSEFAEPREKQIQIDAERIRTLQKQNGELTDKVKKLEKDKAELKKQLERLNGRENCKHKHYELSKGAAVICYNVHSCENCQYTWRTI